MAQPRLDQYGSNTTVHYNGWKKINVFRKFVDCFFMNMPKTHAMIGSATHQGEYIKGGSYDLDIDNLAIIQGNRNMINFLEEEHAGKVVSGNPLKKISMLEKQHKNWPRSSIWYEDTGSNYL